MRFWLIGLLLLPFQDARQPYYDFAKAGAGFYGAGREAPDPEGLNAVRIGVLGPEKDPEGLELRAGVQLALEEANRQGGYHGRIPYEMVFRPDDGFWGVVASRVVDLAYEDKVWTIIGGLDGQRTHIAELVVAKAWVPVVSPWASDSSIDYANVPWVFRCAPADSSQADALVAHVKRAGFKRLVALTEIDREAHTGYRRLDERLERERLPLAAHLQYPRTDPTQVVPRIGEFAPDAILVWGSAHTAIPLIEALRAAGIRVPVLGPSALATRELVAKAASVGDVVVAAPFDLSVSSPGLAGFAARFRAKSGSDPSPLACYAYDTARLVIAAIDSAGLNRARIRDALVQTAFDGITGKIEFNSLRGNAAMPVLMIIRNGRWAREQPANAAARR
jgi:ABC-type branched-subunit amino acid transport system substrate-binding protein